MSLLSCCAGKGSIIERIGECESTAILMTNNGTPRRKPVASRRGLYVEDECIDGILAGQDFLSASQYMQR